MSEVTLVFKCGVITLSGQIDPSSYKFFTWSYVTGGEGSEGPLTLQPLAQRILSLYPEIPEDILYRVVYIDEDNDKIAIPSDNVRETLAALKVIMNSRQERLEEQKKPITVFLQPSPKLAPPTGNTQGEIHSNLHCSGCKKGPIQGFLYKCLQCPHDYNLCGQCDTAGKHAEHVVLRYAGDQPLCWNEMKQLFVRPANTVSVPKSPKLATCTLRVL